jgi:hypothetical protein
MSTKIYVAYRLKDSRHLWPFVRDTRRRGEENVKKELVKLYKTMLDGVDTKSEAYQKTLAVYNGDEEIARLRIVGNAIREMYRAQLGKLERDTFNFDVCVAIREHADRLYVIPHCDSLMCKALDFLKRDKRLEDYAYWNNTDRPSHISQRQWDQRGRIWDAIDSAGWGDHLVIPICDWSNFYMLDPYLDIVKGIYKRRGREKKASAAG